MEFYRQRFTRRALKVTWLLDTPWLAALRAIYGVRIGSWFFGAAKGAVEPLFNETTAREISREEVTMTPKELKQAAIDCLGKAFEGNEVPAHVVQAAVSVLSAPEDEDVVDRVGEVSVRLGGASGAGGTS